MNSQRGNDSKNPRKNPLKGRSDRPRGFPPPPPRESDPQRFAPNDRQRDPRLDGESLHSNLSEHPAFQQPHSGQPAPGHLDAGRMPPASSSQMPPPSGYIPPGHNTGDHSLGNSLNPNNPPPAGYPRSNHPKADYPQSDARYAPPEVRQPLDTRPSYVVQPNSEPRGLIEQHSQNRSSTGPGTPSGLVPREQSGTQPAYGTAPEFAPDPRIASAGNEAVRHPVASNRPLGVVHPHGGMPPHVAPQHVEAPLPKRSSVGKTILKILGWTILLSVIMIGLVVGGGWLTVRNAANQIFNPGMRTTVITKAPVVASLKQVNKQIMIEHNNMVDIDYSEAPEGWLALLPIKQSFVVLLRGRVPAGFDLSSLGEDDVWISNDGTKIQLVLPPPVIFEENVSVNLEESRIVSEGDTCPNFICAQDIEAIQQTILPQGRQLLIETSMKSGIMEQAAEMGIAYYESLLRSLGFEEIQVFIRSDLEIQGTSE